MEITVYEDRSFTFILKTPPAAELIGRGSAARARPHHAPVKVGKISKDQVRQIAETKQADLNANDIEAAFEDHRRHSPLHGHHG